MPEIEKENLVVIKKMSITKNEMLVMMMKIIEITKKIRGGKSI
jgi:hypothetical protein